VFFDLDGTLIDTAPDMGGALNRMLAAHGRSPVHAGPRKTTRNRRSVLRNSCATTVIVSLMSLACFQVLPSCSTNSTRSDWQSES